MPIREKKYYCGEYLEVEIYPITKLEQRQSRKKKKKESRKEQKNINDKNARKLLGRLLNSNFTPKDIALHLTYDDEHLPESEDQVKKDVANYLRRLKRQMKKLGLPPLKYIAVIEFKEKSEDKRKSIRMHQHLVISGGLDRDIIEQLWGKGTANADRLKPNEVGFQELANYVSKNPKGNKRWMQSKNLYHPEPNINDYRFSHKKAWNISRNQGDKVELSGLYPGYIVSRYQSVVNPNTGCTYVYIMMRKLI